MSRTKSATPKPGGPGPKPSGPTHPPRRSAWIPVPVLPMPPEIAAELDRQAELDDAFGEVAAWWLTGDRRVPLLPLPFLPGTAPGS